MADKDTPSLREALQTYRENGQIPHLDEELSFQGMKEFLIEEQESIEIAIKKTEAKRGTEDYYTDESIDLVVNDWKEKLEIVTQDIKTIAEIIEKEGLK